jgi:mannose/cellobiose epimerase-like protein (N-acyl-D-glucosamine 2-epimerase family)
MTLSGKKARRSTRVCNGVVTRAAWMLVVTLAQAGVAAAQTDPGGRLAALVPQMERNLRENVLKFWFPRSVDQEHGGYIVHYGPKGEPLEGGTKMIVTQTRQLWLASRLLRTKMFASDAGLREAADAGFEFLRNRMWDKEHGGFYWEVDPTGREVLQPHKHLYGQAFGLYALSEYVRATKSSEARALADQLFDLLEKRAYDREYGGYREFFARDWSAPPPGVEPYLAAPPEAKLMNTHLHLLEAFTTYVLAGARPLAKTRLEELVAIETQAVVRKRWVACTDKYQRDWTPILDEQNARVSYGHDIENIWLVVDALHALGHPTAPYHDLFRELFQYSREHGYDEEAGGFYDSGPPHKPADRRAKIWWVQAEALVSALQMYQLTGDASYVDVFEKTWRWVDTRQTDWDSGEWHGTIQPDGQPRRDNKAHPWKGGYHNGRALVEAIERITALSEDTP